MRTISEAGYVRLDAERQRLLKLAHAARTEKKRQEYFLSILSINGWLAGKKVRKKHKQNELAR
jgi:hypothetical protein